MGKEYTLSLHNGSTVKQAHNRREQSALGHASAIDSGRTKDNIVLVDIPARQAYADIFGDAVQEYNGRARADRQIKDYWATINADSRKHAAYELIVQVGGKAEGAPMTAVDALKRYVAGWNTANPNLRLVGAYIHSDEGTPHLHLDYIPVAECARGMKLQNSLTGALKAQGFVTANTRDTAQMQWEQAERTRMRDICRQAGIALVEQGNGRKYMSISQYKRYADALTRQKAHNTQEEAYSALLMQTQRKAEERTAQAQARAQELQKQAEELQKRAEQAQRGLETMLGRQENARRTFRAQQQAWTEWQRNNSEYIELLEAFHAAVHKYQPDYAAAVEEFVLEEGRDVDSWPERFYDPADPYDPDRPDYCSEDYDEIEL